MTEVTRILNQIEGGDPSASEKLLPLVYDELRVLARQKLAKEKPGHTLQATALVHEAFLRLVGNDNDESWDNRGHFFAAAAEAMRRILIDSARRKMTMKHGAGADSEEIFENEVAHREVAISELVALDEALAELEKNDEIAASLVKLRYFAGFSHVETAEILGISRRSADRLWLLAKAWLYRALNN